MLLTKPQIKKIFTKSQITLKDMKAVASSPKLKGFDSIDLSGKGITDKIGLILINSKYISDLVELDLSENSLTNDFVNVLVESTKTPKLKDPQLGSNFFNSSVIPFLIEKFDSALNKNPSDGYNDYVCGIAIYYDGDKWIRLYDAAKQGLIDPRDLNNEEIDDASYESAGGAYYTSLTLNKVEDFYWILNEESGDDGIFYNLSDAEAAFEELKVEDGENNDKSNSDSDAKIYDPLKLSEKKKRERAIFINEIEKKCKRRAKKLGMPYENEQEIAEGIKLEMVLIPAGKFVMGLPEKGKNIDDYETQHEVTLTKPFYMGKFEVTQEQWEALMGDNPSETIEAKWPVTYVSWIDCQNYIAKLNAKTNDGYRLPTEAEWEYACRAGTTTFFSVGDELKPTDANHGASSIYKPLKVGTYKPNAFGLYDMHGNVWEWCEDWKADYSEEAVIDPKGPETGIKHVLRGGSFNNYESDACSSYRYSNLQTHRFYSVGFRLAKTI